jgi:hypothetical protein
LDNSKGLNSEQSKGNYRNSLPNNVVTTHSQNNEGNYTHTGKILDSVPTRVGLGEVYNGNQPGELRNTLSDPTRAQLNPIRPTSGAGQGFNPQLSMSNQSPSLAIWGYQQVQRITPGFQEGGDDLESRKIGDSYIMLKAVEKESPQFKNFSQLSSQVNQLFDSIKHSNGENSPSNLFHSMAPSPQNTTDFYKQASHQLSNEKRPYQAHHH